MPKNGINISAVRAY